MRVIERASRRSLRRQRFIHRDRLHEENAARQQAKAACATGDNTACQQAADLDALDKQRDATFHAACDGQRFSAGCGAATRDMFNALSTFATPDARQAAVDDKTGDMTQAHKNELQSYIGLIDASNPTVKTSEEQAVRGPDKYVADPYGVVAKDNTKDAYLVMKFGTEALAVGSVAKDGGGYLLSSDWWARNGMNNAPSYATGLMLAHVDAAAETKQLELNKANNTDLPYIPVDRYTLSYAPTNGFFGDLWGTLLTKLNVESDSVLGLRSQMENIQSSGKNIDWVVHSRGGVEFVLAAQGSDATDLSKNSVVFHAGANTQWGANSMMTDKKIGDVIPSDGNLYRYRDSPNDLVPQIVGLRSITSLSPLNILRSLIGAPCRLCCTNP